MEKNIEEEEYFKELKMLIKVRDELVEELEILKEFGDEFLEENDVLKVVVE